MTFIFSTCLGVTTSVLHHSCHSPVVRNNSVLIKRAILTLFCNGPEPVCFTTQRTWPLITVFTFNRFRLPLFLKPSGPKENFLFNRNFYSTNIFLPLPTTLPPPL